MKKADAQKPRHRTPEVSGLRLNTKERKDLRASVKVLNEQADQLGLLDPLDREPAMTYFAEEGKR